MYSHQNGKLSMKQQREHLQKLMIAEPPVYKCDDGRVIRWYGANIRCAFWDGYDFMEISPHRGMRGSLTSACYSAGKKYRSMVDSGRREPLPEDNRRKGQPRG